MTRREGTKCRRGKTGVDDNEHSYDYDNDDDDDDDDDDDYDSDNDNDNDNATGYDDVEGDDGDDVGDGSSGGTGMRVDGWEERQHPLLVPRSIRSSVINLVEKTHARTRTATYTSARASVRVCTYSRAGISDCSALFRARLSRSVRTSVLWECNEREQEESQ